MEPRPRIEEVRAQSPQPTQNHRSAPGSSTAWAPWPRLPERPSRPPRAGHRVAAQRSQSSQGRAFGASLAAQTHTLDCDLARQVLAPGGRTGGSGPIADARPCRSWRDGPGASRPTRAPGRGLHCSSTPPAAISAVRCAPGQAPRIRAGGGVVRQIPGCEWVIQISRCPCPCRSRCPCPCQSRCPGPCRSWCPLPIRDR
jgi:hypothetical protein